VAEPFPRDSSLVRGAADECLRTVFADQYGDCTMDQATLLIGDLIDLANEDGLDSLYRAAEVLRERLAPATLASYAATLLIGAGAQEAHRRRFTDHEWQLYLAGKCCYQTAYGLPWSTWCEQPSQGGHPLGYCAEHAPEGS
jgi:hypothetical protein